MVWGRCLVAGEVRFGWFDVGFWKLVFDVRGDEKAQGGELRSF